MIFTISTTINYILLNIKKRCAYSWLRSLVKMYSTVPYYAVYMSHLCIGRSVGSNGIQIIDSTHPWIVRTSSTWYSHG